MAKILTLPQRLPPETRRLSSMGISGLFAKRLEFKPAQAGASVRAEAPRKK